jgi:NADH-ubiquinone oxidoreductase chain 5
MMVACGISQYTLALSHLINHAFFKSLLFLTAGAFIHALQDQQDIRRMGSLSQLTPISYSLFL